jgi:hypothetical protein
VVGKATSAKKAQNFVDAVKTLSGSKAVSVGGAKGYTFSAVAKKVEGSSGATDPNATEGLLYVSKGNTIYSVDVIDDNGARARAFLKSFSPA